MNLQCLKTFDLGTKARQARCCEVTMGDKKAMLVVYSGTENIDLGGPMPLYNDPMHIALYSEKGHMIWKRDLPISLIPGVWTMPFIAFDMDGDGFDEIWYLTSTEKSNYVLDAGCMAVERVDSRNGHVIGTYPFPAYNNQWERLCHAYRFTMFAGYVKGEPVFIMQQGIYKDLFFQCYNKDMSLRWERTILTDDGPRAGHTATVYDYNGDGIDEVIFGERIMSLDTGEDIVVLDKVFAGHSDKVQPFIDLKTGKKYIYVCRESGDYDGCPRVYVCDFKGNKVWEDIYSDEWGHYVDDGHIHQGYTFTTKSGETLAYAFRRREKKKLVEHILYNAVTGERVEKLPFTDNMNEMMPIDINGDGIDEFIYREDGEYAPITILDSDGNALEYTGGWWIQIGKFFDYKGEQVVCFYPDENKIRIWGDKDAVESPQFCEKYKDDKHSFLNKLAGCGYNFMNSSFMRF